jgi:type II secretory pathway pseudopilin PulG
MKTRTLRTHFASGAGSRRRARGFSLIEALVSLLVVAFGMLAIAAFQFTLSRTADLAKQRTEATRIAQREIDRVRAFVQRGADGVATDGRLTYEEDLRVGTANTCPTASSPTTIPCLPAVTGAMTNTTFRPQRIIGQPDGAVPATGEPYRWVTVFVRWNDRTGVEQTVSLNSAISDNEPTSLGFLSGGTGTPGSLRPKNRNINVPYPAVNLASCPTGVASCSAFVPPPGNSAYVFNNVTGEVLQECTLTSYPITALSRGTGPNSGIATATATGHPFVSGTWVNVSGVTPAAYNGNVRAGNVVATASFQYPVNGNPGAATVTSATVRRALTEGIDLLGGGLTGVNCGSSYSTPAYLLSGYVRFFTGSNPNADDLINTNGATFDLLSTGPLSISTSSGSAPSSYTCYAQRQKVVSAGTNVRAETIASYSRVANVVTITTARSHSFAPGMVVAVTGTSDYTLGGRFEVATTPSGTTLTYVEIGADVSAGAGGRVELIQELTLAETDPVPTYYGPGTVSTFVAYSCVVTPSNTGTPREWWGQANLVPETSNAGGRAPWDLTTYRVCRYSADYDANGLSNSDHPRYYRQVTGTLDNQNFVVIGAGNSCPTDTAPTFTGSQAGNFNNTNTVGHQPTATFSTAEPTNTATPLPMQ